jgi:hypothetical protein
LFFGNRPNAPVNASNLDLLADNGSDLRQISLFDMVQDHMAVVSHLGGVAVAVPLGGSDNDPAVGLPILGVRNDERFFAEFCGQFPYRCAETPVIFFFNPCLRSLGFKAGLFLTLNSSVVLSDYRGSSGISPESFFVSNFYITLVLRFGFFFCVMGITLIPTGFASELIFAYSVSSKRTVILCSLLSWVLVFPRIYESQSFLRQIFTGLSVM